MGTYTRNSLSLGILGWSSSLKQFLNVTQTPYYTTNLQLEKTCANSEAELTWDPRQVV